MTTKTLNEAFKDIELIPPNPSALDFEEKFRLNLQSFLSGMLKFELEYLETVDKIKGGDESIDLSVALGNITEGADQTKTQILGALNKTGNGAFDWEHNGIIVTVEGDQATGLEYASLADRFNAIDAAVGARATSTEFDLLKTEVDDAHDTATDTLVDRFVRAERRLNDNEWLLSDAIKLMGDSSGTAANFNSIQERFYTSEQLLRKAYSVKKDTTGSGGLDRDTGLFSIEERFSALEDNLSITEDSLSGYASINGDLSQDFNAATLKIGATLDLDSKPLINLPVPRNDADASTKKYVDDEILKRALLEGDSTVLFKVKDVDPADPSHDNQHALSYGYAIANLANIAGNATQDFDAQTLTVSAGLDMNSQFITNLPDPTANDHAVNVNYLTANYTNSTDLGNNYAAIAGSATQDFDIQKLKVHDDVDMNSKLITNLSNPTNTGDAVNLGYLINNYTTSSDLSANYAQKNGDSLMDFSANNLNISGALNLIGGGLIDLQGLSKVINVPSPSGAGDVIPKSYVDTLGTNLDSRIADLELGIKLPDTTGYNAKFLMVKTDGSGITWADPPDLDPSLMVTAPYDWVPSVPWQSIQFDGEVYSSRTLAAGFTYFVAGDLRVADFDSMGNPVELKIQSGSGGIDGLGYPVKGAVLIVQGHIIGNFDGITVDTLGPHKGRLVVLNWSDSKADYVIPEITGQTNQVTTSSLNLMGKNQFSCKLVMEANTELVIDSECELIFKESDLDPSSVITVNSNPATGNPFGSVSYFDPIKIIENAPAALDTLSEISAILQDPNTGNVVNLFSKIEGDVQTVTNLTNQAQTDATQALADASNAQTDATQALADVSNAQTDATQALADASNAQADATQALADASNAQADATQALADASNAQAAISSFQLGHLSFYADSSTGDLVYKLNP